MVNYFKKNILIAAILATGIIPANTWAEEQQPVFTITNITPDINNIIAELSTANAAVKVSADKYTTEMFEQISFSCLPGGNINDYNYLILADQTTEPTGNKTLWSSIMIENTGQAPITRIEFIGFGSTAKKSNCIAAASTDGNNYVFFEDTDIPSPVAKIIAFNGTDLQTSCDDAANGVTALDIPIMAKTNPFADAQQFRENVKYIRINWGISGVAFGGNSVTDKGAKPQIYAIKIYAQDLATAIQENNTEEADIQITCSEKTAYCNQQADITIYNMAGQKVMQVKNTKQAELDNLNKGIYIIKAVSKINGHVFVKKISLV